MFVYQKVVKSWRLFLFFCTVTILIVGFYGSRIHNMVWQQPPRYLHTQDELPPKAKDIFFGVTTCQRYADEYAQAVYQTWARLVEPRMLRFFSDAPHPLLPTVVTSKLDMAQVNKKLKKNYRKRVAHKERYLRQESNRSLELFAWAWDHVPDAKWFYKGDDDSFVRVEWLQALLNEFDATKPLYLGSTRRFRGKLVPVLERDMARTLEHTDLRYAMGGAGYVLSRGLLEQWRPLMNQCIVYNGEDKTVAKCIWDTLHIEPLNVPGFSFVHPDKIDPVTRDSMIAFHQIEGMKDAQNLFRRFYLDRNRFDSGGDVVP